MNNGLQKVEEADSDKMRLEELSKEQLIRLIREQRQAHHNRMNTLRMMVENTSDMVLCINNLLRITAYNQAYAAHIKKLYDKEVREGMPVADLLPEASFVYWKNFFEQCTQKAQRIEVVHQLQQESQLRMLSVTMMPYFGISDDVDGAMIYLKDITEQTLMQQKLTRSEARFRAIMSHTSDIIAVINQHGDTQFITPSFFRLTGFDEQDSSIRNIFTLLHPEDLPIAQAEMQRLIAGNQQQHPLELRVRKRNGSYLYLEIVAANKLGDTNIRGIIVNGRDVTNRKKAEAELIRARKAAEDALKAKENFLSVMSHEIRTPLNAVIGMANLLMQDNPGKHQTENLRVLQASADHLLALINDILDFSKIQAGKLVFESAPFNIRELVENIRDIHMPAAMEKSVLLTCSFQDSLPEWLQGDRVRLSQILHNLVGNAVKFTPKGNVHIHAAAGEPHNNRIELQISVSDTGIGIPQDRIPHIFDLFTQIQNEITRNYGGTGLGLAITKHLVEMQGGTIEVESQPGKGSVFTFSVPYNIAEAPHLVWAKPNTALDNLLKGKQVLYVEDIAFNQILLKNLAKMWEIQLEIASSGMEALQKIDLMSQKGKYFDIIITDILMPVMDGYQVAEKIRQHPDERIAKTPLIALTADVSAAVEQRAQQVGINFCLTKPIDQKLLRQRLTAILADEHFRQPAPTVQNNHNEQSLLPEFIDNPQDLAEFLQIADSQLRLTAEQLQKAIVEANIDLYRQELHAVKPTLLYMHQEELLQKLEEIKTRIIVAGAEERMMAAIKIVGLLEQLHHKIIKQTTALQPLTTDKASL